MSESASDCGVHKLSELRRGMVYSITGDGVQAVFRVLETGATPVCLFQGDIEDHLDHEKDGPMLIQLIGWTRLTGDASAQDYFSMFVLDEQPSEGRGFLIGVRPTPGLYVPFNLACDPIIREVAD